MNKPQNPRRFVFLKQHRVFLALLSIAAIVIAWYGFSADRETRSYYVPREQILLQEGQKVRKLRLPKVKALPVWSEDTSINRIACNRGYKERASGWVIKQWKNQDSLCNDKSQEKNPDVCVNASSQLSTTTTRYCHWKRRRQVLLSVDAAAMESEGCEPNLRGNVGGFVDYLDWEPRLLPDFSAKSERYMIRNMQEIYVRFKFRNRFVDNSHNCGGPIRGEDGTLRSGIVHSYSTATFSELDPNTKKGTGRTIFYQVLNYDARPFVQNEVENGVHEFWTCNYLNNQNITMIHRETVVEFGQSMAFPVDKSQRGGFKSYEFNLLDGVDRGLKRCYEDADPSLFKLTGFHIGTEIRNGAKHEFMIRKPEIEIIYKRGFVY